MLPQIRALRSGNKHLALLRNSRKRAIARPFLYLKFSRSLTPSRHRCIVPLIAQKFRGFELLQIPEMNIAVLSEEMAYYSFHQPVRSITDGRNISADLPMGQGCGKTETVNVSQIRTDDIDFGLKFKCRPKIRRVGKFAVDDSIPAIVGRGHKTILPEPYPVGKDLEFRTL